MHPLPSSLSLLLLLLLPLLSIPSLASPLPLPTCAPTTYTITSFTLTPTTLSFTFSSHFPPSSPIVDPASSPSHSPALCTATASNATGLFPSEFACSTGRENLIVNVRGEKPAREYQVGHFWRCNGNENWASSTRVVIGEGGSAEVVPENVRRMPCGTPTCG